MIVTAKNGDVNLAGNIVTTGAANNAGTGGAGGQVDVATLTSGAVTVGNITSSGGASSGGTNTGGAAGAINVTSTGTTKDVTLNGTLTALGGAGTTPGATGTVTLTATGAIVDDEQRVGGRWRSCQVLGWPRAGGHDP